MFLSGMLDNNINDLISVVLRIAGPFLHYCNGTPLILVWMEAHLLFITMYHNCFIHVTIPMSHVNIISIFYFKPPDRLHLNFLDYNLKHYF